MTLLLILATVYIALGSVCGMAMYQQARLLGIPIGEALAESLLIALLWPKLLYGRS